MELPDIDALITRVERAFGPDRDLDLKLGLLWPEPRPFYTDKKKYYLGDLSKITRQLAPHFTTTEPDALLLMDAILPGWTVTETVERNGEAPPSVTISDGVTTVSASAPTVTLATLLATLKAYRTVVA